MRTSLIVFGLALLPLLAGAQNARPVLADTNGVIRVGTVGSELTSLNASNLASGTAPTNVLPGILSSLSVGNGAALTNLPLTVVWGTNNVGTVQVVPFPSGAKQALVIGIGNGGSGGSGRRGSAGSLRTGGSAGGGGAIMRRHFILSDFYTNHFTYIIYPSGAGGGSVSTDDSDGTNGVATSNDPILWIGTNGIATNQLMRPASGSAGNKGTSTGAAAAGSAGTVGDFLGTAGGASSGTGGTGSNGSAHSGVNSAATGGGAGGGISTGDVPSAGGNGGVAWSVFPSTYLGTGGSVGANGTSISVVVSVLARPFTFWPGAGGGGAQTNAVAGNGADGYGWGSGGGGGGASLNGYASGAGGRGGPGAFLFIFY